MVLLRLFLGPIWGQKMCVLQSPMSTGIVQYIRKSFFGPKTWGGALTNFYWRRGEGGLRTPCSLCSTAYGLSVCQAWQKREKNHNAACVQQASTWREEKIIIKKKNQSKTHYSRTPLTATDSQRRALNNGHFILSRRTVRTITPCSFCHVNILIQNIVQALGVFYLYMLFMIGLPSWDTVSMN